ncbi:MAG: hypothetical protein JWP44_5133 [Mucilaginibacter sp.]|nr:hypothetical protein [Mucilaginibacter sp.]
MYKISSLTFFLLFSTLLAIGQVNSGNRFYISGYILNRDTGSITLSYSDDTQKWIADTVAIHKGKFNFNGKIDKVTVARLTMSLHVRSVDDPNYTEIFLEPQRMQVRVYEGHFKEAQIKGSHSQYLIKQINAKKAPIIMAKSLLNKAFNDIRTLESKQGLTSSYEAKIDSIKKLMLPFDNQLKLIDLAFIKEHPNELVSAYLLGYYIDREPPVSINNYYQALTSPVRNGYYGQQILRALTEKKISAALVGDKAPEFVLSDLKGRPVDLQQFKYKNIVLLDFWASWCGPCRAMNPYLRNINKTYGDRGLAIISISADTDPVAWRKAVLNDKMEAWNNVISTTELLYKYGVTSAPAYILIDMNGLIVGRYDSIGNDPTKGLLNQLNSLVNNKL